MDDWLTDERPIDADRARTVYAGAAASGAIAGALAGIVLGALFGFAMSWLAVILEQIKRRPAPEEASAKDSPAATSPPPQ